MNDFQTADLALSAFLQLQGLKLKSVTSIGRGRAYFIFCDAENRESLVMKFFSGAGRVDPAAYIGVFKSLKSAAMEAQSHDMKGKTHETFTV